MIKFARGKAPFLVKQIVELDRSAPSHLHHLDLQTSLRLGHTQSCQGKAPGSHLLPALLVLGMESALSRYITRKGKDIGGSPGDYCLVSPYMSIASEGNPLSKKALIMSPKVW